MLTWILLEPGSACSLPRADEGCPVPYKISVGMRCLVLTDLLLWTGRAYAAGIAERRLLCGNTHVIFLHVCDAVRGTDVEDAVRRWLTTSARARAAST
eukprot:2892659-Rhodomonas_salina.2